jgi:hypothetical protein
MDDTEVILEENSVLKKIGKYILNSVITCNFNEDSSKVEI